LLSKDQKGLWTLLWTASRLHLPVAKAFTSAFKELEPIPQYKATAKLAGFLQAVRPSQP